MGAILDAIYARRSVRRFQPDPVSQDALMELARAGAAAPSAHNTQPWEFVLVTDPRVLAQLRKMHAYSNYEAPAAVVICGNSAHFIKDAPEFWVQDCSAAMENILLAALDLDLGTVWLGVYPSENNVEKVRQILSLPSSIIPMGVAYVGHPVETPKPRTQLRPDQVHWQTYRP